jgi:hypothetical protein
MFIVTNKKLYNTQGIKNIKATTIGNSFNQQNDISWSKRILGNDALIQINVNIIAQDLIPNIIP